MLTFDGITISDLTDHTIWFELSDMVEDDTQSIAEHFNQFPGKGGEWWITYLISKNSAGEAISITITGSATKPSFVP